MITMKSNEKMPEAIRLINQVIAQREEILTAFYAKYQCHPDEIVQVEKKYPDGTVTWQPMRKEDFNSD